jgi:hypothetical protein
MAERKRFLLRISPELYAELEKWAADEFRSVNAQIEFLLQRSVNDRRRGRRSADVAREAAPDTTEHSNEQR